jgi:hypothetical protein
MSANNNDSPTPALSFHPDRMVTLLVGPEHQKICALDDRLSRDSAWFRAELMKEQHLQNGQSRVIKLDKESPAVVQHYIAHVVYGDELPTHDVTDAWTPDRHQYALLAQLYVLGGRLFDAEYQN